MIQLTVDYPSNYDDGKMPILDMRVWMNQKREIEYIFYEKPMRSNLVIGKNSALPMMMKMKTLTQETFRRIHNTRESLREEYLPEILSKYSQKLKDSGYSEEDRLSIIEGGFKTHENILKLEAAGKRDYYRTPENREKERNGKNRNEWYKKAGNNYTAVMFVEPTPGGNLVKELRNIEEKYKISNEKRIKFVEKSGRKLVDKIRIADPFRENCKDSECLACKSATKFKNCRKTNIGYSIQCKLCKSRGIIRSYEGESGRNLYRRSKEHSRQLKTGNKNSVLMRHINQEHSTEANDVSFSAEVTGTFKKPLQRILNEGLRIKWRKQEELLNSKNEYFGPSVKRK